MALWTSGICSFREPWGLLISQGSLFIAKKQV
jgi:hypothetical protein